jgi:hypothetical protein
MNFINDIFDRATKAALAIGLAIGFSASSFATGSVPANSTQSGVVNFTVATGLSYTNTFAAPFTTTPVVITYNLLAASTVSALTVTTTNFVVTVTNAATPTNGSVSWQAYLPSPRLQYGSNTGATSGSTTITNTFNPPYYSAPAVVVTGSVLASATNNYPAVTSVTTTNFIISCGNTNQTFYWHAVGPGYSPGAATITY